jgi:hypothetical protein
MLTPNQLNLIADKLRMLRGRIHAELATTLRQADNEHARDLRQQLQDVADDLRAIEEEHVYLNDIPPSGSTGFLPGTVIRVLEKNLSCVVMKPGEYVEVYTK